jgi:hypothetical protein
MNYSETLLLWKPGTLVRKSTQILVTPLEPFGRSQAAELSFFGDKSARSGGAAYSIIRSGTPDQNRRRVMIDFNTLVVRDHMDPDAVHAAFCEIQEYRDQLSPDTPVPEKWQRVFRREVMES